MRSALPSAALPSASRPFLLAGEPSSPSPVTNTCSDQLTGWNPSLSRSATPFSRGGYGSLQASYGWIYLIADTPPAFARRHSSLDPIPRAWSRTQADARRTDEARGGWRERKEEQGPDKAGWTPTLTAAVTFLRREQAGGRLSTALAHDGPDRASLASCLLLHQTCPPETESRAQGGKWARFQNPEEEVTADTTDGPATRGQSPTGAGL